MKSSFIWKIFGFVLMVHQSECQNMAGLIATLTGGLNNGFPNTGSAGGTSNCPFLPHRDKHKFIQNGSEMTCAPGTVYDRLACRCVDANAPKGPPQPGSNPRVEALANAMKGMRSAPPGMQQMMTELFRQFQSTTGVSNAPPPPIIPRNNQAPPAFPKQFTPSRSVPPLNQRRQMITKPPTQSKKGEVMLPPPPLPTSTSKVKKITKRKHKGKKVNRKGRKGRQRKPARGKKIAKLVLNSKNVPPGPPYDRKPEISGQKPKFSPIQKTDKLPVDLLKIMQAFQDSVSTTPKPINRPLRELLAKPRVKSHKGVQKTGSPAPTQQSNPFSSLLAMLSSPKQESKPAKKIRPPSPTQPSDQLTSLLAMLSNPKQDSKPTQKVQPPPPTEPSDPFSSILAMLSSSKLEPKPTQTAQPPVPTKPSDPFNSILAMLSNTNQEPKPTQKVTPPPPTQPSDPFSSILAMLSGSKQTNENTIPPRPEPPSNNVLGNPLAGVRPTGSGRKFGGPGRGSGTNSMLGRGGPGSGFGGSMTNPFAGMGGPGGMGSMGALGGLGGGSPDLTNLLGALGGGSGLAGLGPLGALSGSTRPGAAPPDLTNMFNSQGRMIPATMTALTSINLPLLNIMDRQGYVDVSDLTPQGKIAASRFFSQSGSMARLASLGPLGQLG